MPNNEKWGMVEAVLNQSATSGTYRTRVLKVPEALAALADLKREAQEREAEFGEAAKKIERSRQNVEAMQKQLQWQAEESSAQILKLHAELAEMRGLLEEAEKESREIERLILATQFPVGEGYGTINMAGAAASSLLERIAAALPAVDEHGECPNCANPPHDGPCQRALKVDTGCEDDGTELSAAVAGWTPEKIHQAVSNEFQFTPGVPNAYVIESVPDPLGRTIGSANVPQQLMDGEKI